MGRTVKVVYHADTLQTEITVDGEPFDTSRINGKEIEDWAYPFMMRKVKWGGFYEEMVEALNGEKAFNLIFEGSKEALAELQEAWEDAPVTIVEETAEPTVEIEYDADALTTSITVNGEPFDTTRINGREIEDWIYPFMMRKIKWDGIFEELTKFIGSESYHISFTGEEKWLSALEEECPETVTISLYSKNDNSASDNIQAELLLKLCSELSQRRYYLSTIYKELSNDLESACMSKSRMETDKSIAIIQSSLSSLEWDYVLKRIKRTVPEKFIEQYKKELQAIVDKMKIEYPPLSDVEWLQKGEAAYKSKDFENAFLFFSEANKRDNKLSSKYLAECYFYGYGVKQSNAKAYKMCKKALETIKNDATLMYMMGYFYQNSIGVSADMNEAKAWYKKAANAGNRNAKNALKEIANKEEECLKTVTISGKSKQETIDFDYISFNSNGFSISDKAFQEYYANMDHGMMTQHLSNEITNAMHQLIQNDSFSVSIQSITDVSGVMATDSICTANSIKQVIDCISKIYDSWDSPRANVYRSSNGIPWNQGFVIEISLSGGNNDKNSLTNQVPNYENKSAKELYEMAGACEDDEEAFALLKKSADLGYAEAQCTLATLYYLGKVVEEDNEQAYFYYKKAANQNHAEAQYWLGEIYYNGYGVMQNYSEAFKWYTKSAKNGDLDAMLSLGNCYLYGDGTKKNVNQAISWYKKGADQNEPGCQYQLGMCYWDGNGVKKNKSTAFSLFEKSAQQGYARANNKLGLIYHEGEYADTDFQKAMSYYQLAANDGFPTAMYNLGILYQDLNDVENARKWLNEALEAGFEDAREALENLNDSELEIDINDPMDTTYDLDQHNNFQATFIHHSENIEIYDDEEKNFVYSLFVFITPEYSKKIISILDASSNIFTDKSEYDSVSSCYNDLAKCYDIDSSEETEFKRVQNARKIVDRIYSYKKRNVMKWILKEISESIPLMRSYDLDLDMDKIRNAGNVLSASNDKLKVLISEINSNFNKNKDKIFTYFYEIDNVIIPFMFYKVYRTQMHFNNAYSEYLDADASILNSISDFISGNDTTEEWKRQLKKHIDTAKSTIYISAIINALYYICNDAMNAITENLNENNNFFDEI